MARLTFTQKAERVLRLLLALRHPGIAGVLAQHGFGDADLEEGWALLRACTRDRVEGVRPPPESRQGALIAELDAWENRWFPITRAVLARHAPDLEPVLFRNLSQRRGFEAVLSVGSFVTRLESLAKPVGKGGIGKRGVEARAILERRGLTDEVVARARALLAELESFGPPPSAPEDRGESLADRYAGAERALWSYYLEWTHIARTVIKNRALLRHLGFARGASGGEDDVEAAEAAPATGAKQRT